MTASDLSTIAAQLRQLIRKLPSGLNEAEGGPTEKDRRDLESIASELSSRVASLDTTAQPDAFFNPADPRLFGVFAALAMVGQEKHPLSSLEGMKFYGSGVYALYYRGAFKLYEKIANTEHPIYVGKADPSVPHARTPKEQGLKLWGRLREHAKSVSSTANLDLTDFDCRYLVAQSGYQGQAEGALIRLFRPLWNSEIRILYGIGKHGDASTTRANKRSPWDTLHPGRSWAKGTTEDAKTTAQIKSEVGAHLGKHPPVASIAAILSEFMSEIRHQPQREATKPRPARS